MNEILEMIRAFLQSDSEDATEFSVKLEDALCNQYDQMMKENKEATEILNDELPEICADYEPGKNVQEFKDKIRAEFEKALRLMA